jgi:hypothetical protein
VNRRGDENYNIVGRLKPGVTMREAQEDIAGIAGRIRNKDHRDRTFTISVVPLLDQVVGNVRRSVLIMLGAVDAGAADRVRECSEPVVVARDRTRKRSGHPLSFGSGADAASAAIAD